MFTKGLPGSWFDAASINEQNRECVPSSAVRQGRGFFFIEMTLCNEMTSFGVKVLTDGINCE